MTVYGYILHRSAYHNYKNWDYQNMGSWFKQSLILMLSSDVTRRRSDFTDLCIFIRIIIWRIGQKWIPVTELLKRVMDVVLESPRTVHLRRWIFYRHMANHCHGRKMGQYCHCSIFGLLNSQVRVTDNGSNWAGTCADSFISAFSHERFCKRPSVW